MQYVISSLKNSKLINSSCRLILVWSAFPKRWCSPSRGRRRATLSASLGRGTPRKYGRWVEAFINEREYWIPWVVHNLQEFWVAGVFLALLKFSVINNYEAFILVKLYLQILFTNKMLFGIGFYLAYPLKLLQLSFIQVIYFDISHIFSFEWGVSKYENVYFVVNKVANHMVTTLCYYFVYYEVQVFVYYIETPYNFTKNRKTNENPPTQVLSGGLAAREGLPQRAQSADGRGGGCELKLYWNIFIFAMNYISIEF